MQSLYYKIYIKYFISNYKLVKPFTVRVLTILIWKRSLKITSKSKAKREKATRKKSISQKYVFFLKNKSNINILILGPDPWKIWQMRN